MSLLQLISRGAIKPNPILHHRFTSTTCIHLICLYPTHPFHLRSSVFPKHSISIPAALLLQPFNHGHQGQRRFVFPRTSDDLHADW